MKKSLAIVIGILLATQSWGDSSRQYLENDFAQSLWRTIDLYRAANHGVTPTNWSQLRTILSDDYLTTMEREFEHLRDAGFRTCIVEKYVFLPPGMKVQGYPQSRVLLLSVSPTRVGSGPPGRYLIFDDDESSPDSLRYGWIAEDRIQQMLAVAGIKFLTPEPAEVRAAKEAIEELVAKEKAEREIIRHNAPRPSLAGRWTVLQEGIKGIFIKPISNGISGGTSGQAQAIQIRLVPVVIVILLSAGIIAFAVRLWLRHKPSSAPQK